MVRKGEHNFIPAPDTALAPGDALLVVADRPEVIAKAAGQLGKARARTPRE